MITKSNNSGIGVITFVTNKNIIALNIRTEN